MNLNEFLATDFGPGDWGPWRLDPHRLVLVLIGQGDHWSRPTGAEIYEVDLEDCLTSAQTLDWICQVASKTFTEDNPNILAGLIHAIDTVLWPQDNLCSWGHSKRIAKKKVAELAGDVARKWPQILHSNAN